MVVSVLAHILYQEVRRKHCDEAPAGTRQVQPTASSQPSTSSSGTPLPYFHQYLRLLESEMMQSLVYSLAVASTLLFSTVIALPAEKLQPQLRPLVVWHGMGDSHDSPGMLEIMQEVRNMYPGIFVHSVYLAESTDDDRKAGYVRTA